jgi:hypothetical protein
MCSRSERLHELQAPLMTKEQRLREESDAFTLEDAIVLATRLQRGQTDKAGRPCTLHPLPVMARLSDEPQRLPLPSPGPSTSVDECRGLDDAPLLSVLPPLQMDTNVVAVRTLAVAPWAVRRVAFPSDGAMWCLN